MKHCCCSPVAMAARVSEVTAAAREAPAIGAVMARTSFCYTVGSSAQSSTP